MAAPAVGLGLLLGQLWLGLDNSAPWVAGLSGVALVGCIVAAIHHAEIVAHRTGEPFGTLLLALAITVIEVGLIISLMLSGDGNRPTLARDALYAALMILCNGVVGLSLLLGALRHREQSYRVEGASSALAAVIALATLALIMPNFTTSAPGAAYSTNQLIFVALASFILWAVFTLAQTGRHRDYFLPQQQPDNEKIHATPPSNRACLLSFLALLAALIAVVGLAKILSPNIENAVQYIGAPKAVVGIIIALLVLLPETGAALRAARANRFQTSMNLALGSAMASIGLTIPAVVAVCLLFQMPLLLGLAGRDMVLLGLTFVISAITFRLGRTNIILASVHLVLFAAFLFLAFEP